MAQKHVYVESTFLAINLFMREIKRCTAQNSSFLSNDCFSLLYAVTHYSLLSLS